MLFNENWEEEDYIAEEEVIDAVSSLKLGRAPGVDDIAPEMMKYLGVKGTKIFQHLLNLIWKGKNIPKDWEISVIAPIFKKGGKRECKIHRGVSLLSVPSKVYYKILEKRLMKTIEPILDDAQYGFRQNRSCQDLIFTLRLSSENDIE